MNCGLVAVEGASLCPVQNEVAQFMCDGEPSTLWAGVRVVEDLFTEYSYTRSMYRVLYLYISLILSVLIFFLILLSVILLSAILLSVILSSPILSSVILLSVILLSVTVS